MKVTKLASIFLAAGLLAACSHDSSDDDSGTVVEHLHNVTDLSQCQGSPVLTGSIYGAWNMDLASQDLNMTLTYQVNATSTTVTNTCTYPDGYQITASVTVPSQVVGNQYTILSGNQDSENQGGFSCSVSANAMTSYFAFVGNCLQLTTNGQTGYMVP